MSTDSAQDKDYCEDDAVDNGPFRTIAPVIHQPRRGSEIVTEDEGKQRHQGKSPRQDRYGDKSSGDVEQRPKNEGPAALGDKKADKLIVLGRGRRMLPVVLRLPEKRVNGVRENDTNHHPAKASHEAVRGQSKKFHDFGSHGTRATLRITDPAPVMSEIKLSRDRRVRCIRFVRFQMS